MCDCNQRLVDKVFGEGDPAEERCTFCHVNKAVQYSTWSGCHHDITTVISEPLGYDFSHYAGGCKTCRSCSRARPSIDKSVVCDSVPGIRAFVRARGRLDGDPAHRPTEDGSRVSMAEWKDRAINHLSSVVLPRLRQQGMTYGKGIPRAWSQHWGHEGRRRSLNYFFVQDIERELQGDDNLYRLDQNNLHPIAPQ